MAKLTGKQERFISEYLIDCNATQAAIRAGYSKKTAMQIGEQNLRKVVIKEEIERKLGEIQDKRIADVTEIMEYFTSVMRGESKASVIVGENELLKAPDEKERLRAAENLQKRYAVITDKEALEKLDDILAEVKANATE